MSLGLSLGLALASRLAAASGPTIASVSPSTGTTAGGTPVTITGTGFTGATSASLGGVDLTSFAVVNDTTITGVTGAHAAGAVTAVVGAASLANAFTYAIPAPALTSLNWNVTDKAGGDSVTITGTDLGSATSCTWGGTTQTITANTSTSLTFTTTAKASASYNVQVTTAAGASNTLALEAWSPVDLSLNLLHRASYTGSPWTGQASAGDSSGRNSSEATHPPTTGAAVNGKTPADFDGTNQELTIANTMSETVGGASFSGIALVYIDSINRDSATISNDDTIISSATSGRFGVGLRSSGTVNVYLLNSVFATPVASKAIATGAWQFVHWRLDLTATGQELAIGVAGSWGSGVASLVGSYSGNDTFTLKLGLNAGTDVWLDGKMLEVALCKSVISDANLTKWRKYASCKYGLSL